MRKGIKILVNLIAAAILVVIFLPFSLALLLQIPHLQSAAADAAMRMASEKLGVEVRIEGLHVGFFNRIEVEGFYVEDFDRDTLLYASHAEVAIQRLGLLGDGIVFGDGLLHDAKFFLRESSRGEMNVREVVQRMRPEKREKKNPLALTFKHLEVEGLEFRLIRNEEPRYPTGINWADFRLFDVWGHLSDLSIRDEEVTIAIDRLAGSEQTGFHFDNLAGDLLIGEGRIAMAGVEILTHDSEIHIPSLDLSGNDWVDYRDFVERVAMEIRVEDSSLSTDDIAYFAPTLTDWHLQAEAISLDVSGTVSDLTARIHSLEFGQESALRARLRMRGLPDVEHTRFEVKLHQLKGPFKELSQVADALLQKPLSPRVVRMVGRAGEMNISGQFGGLLNRFTADLLVASDVGTVQVEAAMQPEERGSGLQASLSTRALRAGRLLAIQDWERLSIQASARGVLTSEGPDLWVDALLSDLYFREVEYDSIQLDALLRGDRYEALLKADTDPLKMSLAAAMERDGALPHYTLDLDLQHADLSRMHLNRRDSISELSLRMVGDVEASSIDDLNGQVEIRDARYRYNDSLIEAPQLQVRAQHSEAQHSLELNGPFMDARFTASRGYKEAFADLKRALAPYLPNLYAAQEEPIVRDTLCDEEEFSEVELNLKRLSPITRAVVKGLDVADNTHLTLRHHARSGALALDVHSDFIERENMLAIALDLRAHNEGDSLLMALTAADLYLGKLRLSNPDVVAGARDSRFAVRARLADSTKMAADLALRGQLERTEEERRRLILAVDSSHFSLGRKQWLFSAPLIAMDSSRVRVDRFEVESPGERLLLDGVASYSREDTMRLDLQNFDLSPLAQFIAAMGYRLQGTSNGYAVASSLLHNTQITADIDIDSLTVNERTRVAPLKLLSRWDFEKNQAGLYIINRPLADTVIRGFYIPTEGRYGAKMRLDTLPVSLLDPILQGIISNTQGHARVDLRLLGEGRNASLGGSIHATDLATTIDFTQVRYSVPEVRMQVENNRFVATDVPVYDPEGNRGTLQFNLDLNHLSNIAYNIRVNPNKMLVLDTGKKDNDLFYGKIHASGHATIAGDKMGVRMNVNATTDDNSAFYMPLTGSTNISKADFVTFLSADLPDTTDYLVRRRMMFERRTRQKEKSSGNMDINLSLNVRPNLDFNLVIDPQAGDMMRGKGAGLLNIHVNPHTSVFEMYGDYVIQEGSYLFTLQNVINKRFLIESGSSIQWTGEPIDAMLNINALYKVRTSLQPLLGASTSSGHNANTRTVPVECVIHLGDRLSNPSKAFSIRVPQADSETQTAVANILNNETTIARQFIYLLAFNSFYPENATASSDNIGAVATAATGFELLANQVGNLLSGDRYSIILRYRPETEMTSDEVDFGFSSNLINNRLLVEVEGNYMLDNKQATSSKMSNFMGEAYITWMIDRAGNLKLRGFTQTIDRFDETQGLQETGIGIYYKEDFDNLREWRAQLRERFSSENRKARRAERQARRAERKGGVSTSETSEESPSDRQLNEQTNKQ